MIQNISTTCFILALFERSDGGRFLLGGGDYVFKDSQSHFSANTMSNDVVEVQGNDGYLLAGQVRRPGTQVFEGYIGGGTTDRATVENLRQDFMGFFRKNYLYRVIYIFPDGTAIQRKRGFLVDVPVAEELYQINTEYHVALNFEDINYYQYDENVDGEEIYGKSARISLTGGGGGGLVWDRLGAVSYSGKNLLPIATGKTQNGLTFTVANDGKVTVSGTSTGTTTLEWTGITLEAGTYTMSGCPVVGSDDTYRMDGVYISEGSGFVGYDYGYGFTFTLTANTTITFRIRVASGITLDSIVFLPMLTVNNHKNLLTLDNLDARTSSGLTASFDGSTITVNGTSTGFIELVNQEALDMSLQAGTYTFSMTQLSGSYTLTYQAMALYIFNDSGSAIAVTRSDGGFASMTFNLPSATKIKFRFLINNPGAVFNNWKIGMQIERSSTAGAYEAFVLPTYEPYIGSEGVGYIWEAGGEGGAGNITINSIDDVYPVLIITGETINPIITNVTNGTIFQYNGTITASQILVVDMLNQTATLNGTSVIGNVLGDWLYLSPGSNNITYATTNSSAPSAKLEWQEIVG